MNAVRQGNQKVGKFSRAAIEGFTRIWWLVAALIASPVSGASLRLQKVIPMPGVEGRLDHLTADVVGRRVFVSALENQSIEVIDLERSRQVRHLSGIREPQGLLFLPKLNRLLVCSRGDGTCRSLDATRFTEGPWVDVGRNADNLRLDPARKVIYVGSAGEPGDGRMTALDLVSLLPVSEGGRADPPHSPADFLLDRPRQSDPVRKLLLPAHPESFQIDFRRHRILVNVPDVHQIVVVNDGGTGLRVEGAWPVNVGEKNFPMAVDSDGDRLFIACRKPASLVTYDLRDGRFLSSVPCVGDADDLYYDADHQRVLVIGGEGYFDVFSTPALEQTPRRIDRIATATRARTGLLIPELRRLVIAAPHTGRKPAALLVFSIE